MGRAWRWIVGASASAVAVWACTSAPAEHGSESDITSARSLTIGTCELAENVDPLTTAPPEPLSAPVQFRPQPRPTAGQVLQRIELTAHFAPDRDRLRIERIEGKVARGASTGSVTFETNAGGGHLTSIGLGDDPVPLPDGGRPSEDGRSFERLGYESTSNSLLKLDQQETPLTVAVLHWESTGQRYALFGRKSEGGRVELVASTTGCTFDPAVWKLMMHMSDDCYDELFDAEGRPKPPPPPPERNSCHHGPADTFAEFDARKADLATSPHRDAGASDGAADAAPQTDATAPDPEPDPKPDPQPDASADMPGASDQELVEIKPTQPFVEDDGEYWAPDEAPTFSSDGGTMPKKKKKQAQSACNAAPGEASSPAGLALVGVAAVLAARRRRRDH